jgi:hypothetical protein
VTLVGSGTFNWANLLFCPSTKAGAPTPFMT